MSRASIVLALVLMTPAAHAAEVPTAWWTKHIRSELSRAQCVRLVGDGWWLALRSAVADSAGIGIGAESEVIRSEGHGVPDASSSPVAWERIGRLDTGRPGSGVGLLYGAFIGTAVAIVIAVADEPRDDEEDFRRVVLPAVLIAGGGGVGWITGSQMTEWRILYPPP